MTRWHLCPTCSTDAVAVPLQAVDVEGRERWRCTRCGYVEPLKKHGRIRHNVTKRDGLKFDSDPEMARWDELLTLERAGAIVNLEHHPRYELCPAFYRNGRKVQNIEYEADSRYIEGGRTIVEDVKGMITDVFALKQKMFWRLYPDLELRIIPAKDYRKRKAA